MQCLALNEFLRLLVCTYRYDHALGALAALVMQRISY